MKELLKRITVNPAVMTGLPCIRCMRIPVTTVLGMLASGAIEKEILADYPTWNRMTSRRAWLTPLGSPANARSNYNPRDRRH